MNLINVNSYGEFTEYLGGYPRSGAWYYRGVDASHCIIPSMCYKDVVDKVKSFEQYERLLIDRFYNALDKSIKKQFTIDDWEIWFMARHFGLKSRLIDFTHDDTIAIQFAFESSISGTVRIYCLHEAGIRLYVQNKCRTSPFLLNELCVIQPSTQYMEAAEKQLGLSRIFIQMGKFVHQPLATIKIPLTQQIPEYYWKVFEIKQSFFSAIKKEINDTQGIDMNRCLLKSKETRLDRLCRIYNCRALQVLGN